MPSTKVVSVYICSHVEIEYVDVDDLEGPVIHTFLECPCSHPACHATDPRWSTEQEAATPEERESLKFLWRQLGSTEQRAASISLTRPVANVLQHFIPADSSESITNSLSEARCLLKHANAFQHTGAQRPFFEYCLSQGTRLINDAKAQIKELTNAVRGVVPERVRTLRREVSFKPTGAGPRLVFVRRELREPIESLVLGVKALRVSKERPMDRLVHGMKSMGIAREKRVRFQGV